MAKNKILGWMGAIQGIKDFAAIALQSFRKTSLEALKALTADKAIMEKTKEVGQPSAKDVGLEALRDIQKKTVEKQKKSEYADGGIFAKTFNRKPGSKEQ